MPGIFGDGDCDCDECFLLPILELLLLLPLFSSVDDDSEFVPFCSAFTISCLASEVLVPGLVRLIFIFKPLSSVAW